MKTIDVFQCELGKSIPLKYLGRVKYFGESFWVEGLTNLKEYDIVLDAYGDPKVVDDSEEDYIYDLLNPRPSDGSSKGGIFKIIDDPEGFLQRYGLER